MSGFPIEQISKTALSLRKKGFCLTSNESNRGVVQGSPDLRNADFGGANLSGAMHPLGGWLPAFMSVEGYSSLAVDIPQWREKSLFAEEAFCRLPNGAPI